MTDWIPVSVIIVNYNAGGYLSECVESVMDLCKEIVVVDNASADSSIADLKTRISDVENVKVVENKENLGFSAACNIGAEMSTQPYLLFLNPDCVVDREAPVRMLNVFTSDTSIGMVGGFLANPDGTEQAGGRRAIPTPWRSFVRAFGFNRLSGRWPKLFFDFYLHEQPLPPGPIEVEAISGACMLVQDDQLRELGMWDESYFLHCEDLDLCMRYRQQSKKIIFVPDAIVVHAHGVCSKDRHMFVEWHKHKGMVRFYKKYFQHQYPGVLMWLVCMGVWLRFGLIAVTSAVRHLIRGLGIVRG